MLKEYYRYIREYWQIAELNRWYFALNFIACLLFRAFAVALPFIAGVIVDALTAKNSAETYHFIIIYFVIYLCYRGAIYFSWRAYSWNANYSYRQMHKKIFAKLTNIDDSFTRKIKKGRFMNTVNDDLISVGDMSDELSEFATTLLQVVVVLVIVGIYNPLFTILIIVSLILYISARNYADRKMNHYWYKTRKEEDEYSNFISQVATGLQEVKTFNMLPKLKHKLRVINYRYNKHYERQRHYVSLRDTDVNFLYYLFQAILYVLLAALFFNGQIELGVVVMIVAYHESIINHASDFIDAAKEIRLANASVKRLGDILRYRPEENYEFGRTSIEHLDGKIEFKKVSLKINNKPILRDLSFKIKPHETVAIVGFPGAGKTMLINLMLRLRRPTSGKILLDDIEIGEFSKEIYTSSVAVANQAPFIFNTTIRNNLDFVDTDIKAQIKACKTAGVHDFIQSLPQGYNTVLRENAANVSGGQKQMISIARTILTDAEILLLDDITTSLDPDTATFIPQLIKNLKKDHTVIMVTRKPDLMALADKVIVLNRGKIEAIGTPRSLFDKSKTYRALQFASSDLGRRKDA